jgi:hypothetical protein
MPPLKHGIVPLRFMKSYTKKRGLACKSMLKIAFIVKHATSKTRVKTSIGSHQKAVEAPIIPHYNLTK